MGRSHNQPSDGLTDEEEAEIQRQIASDPEDSDASDADIAHAKPFREALPELYDSMRRGRGRPKLERPKQLVSLRLDSEVVEKFKATGRGWQSRINEALRKARVG